MYDGINVVAILGGLGSQMFKYAFFLDLKKKSQKQTYIDLSPFTYLKMWNGFELSRIFCINPEDIYDISKSGNIIEKGYANNVLEKLCSNGIAFHINRGIVIPYYSENSLINFIKNKANRKIWYYKHKKSSFDQYPPDYYQIEGNVYFDEFDHRSSQYINDSQEVIKSVFRFPDLLEDKNIEMSKLMSRDNTIAIHIRRSDHLYDNLSLIDNGYYKKATRMIKDKILNGSFFVFSDDISWCKSNKVSIGLSEDDEVYYIDWNIGEKSYIDMQLMTFCQHHIIPISSFSWWGYYLCSRKNNINIAPNGYWTDVQYHF